LRVYSLYMYSWCHCHSLSLASVKSRLVLLFWYRLTRVVPEKRAIKRVYVCMYVYSFYCLSAYVSDLQPFLQFYTHTYFSVSSLLIFSLIACGRLLKHMGTHTVSVSIRILHLYTVSNNHHCWWKNLCIATTVFILFSIFHFIAACLVLLCSVSFMQYRAKWLTLKNVF